MKTIVNIGGKDRQVQIDAGIAYDYEIETGRPLAADFDEILSGGSMVRAAQLFYTVLATPIRLQGGVVDFTPRDVSVWAIREPDKMKQIGQMVADAFNTIVDVEDEPVEDEKKTKE